MIFSLADCTWDFFSCTNNFGTWPDNKICCEERFDRCCEKVNGGKKPAATVTTTSKPVDNPSSSGDGLQLSKLFYLARCLDQLMLNSVYS